jgi:D-alanine-D-alanine ligase
MLVDEGLYDAEDQQFSKRRADTYFEAEFHVSAALRRVKAEVTSVPATENLIETISAVKRLRPHVVFNLVEHIGGRRRGDGVVAAVLETEGFRYTGASAKALMIARDKHLSKIVVAGAGVSVPKSIVVTRLPAPSNIIKFPAIVKPLNEDASDGIGVRSFVTNPAQLALQVKRVIEAFKQPAICEEFVVGRELYVTLSGINRITVDSICELVFPEAAPVQFATHRVKFDVQYRTKYKISYRKSPILSLLQKRNVYAAARAAYRALEIASYAKLEFRLCGDNVFFLEANPNSNLSRFSSSTDFKAIGYEYFIEKIVRMALNRSQC